jgi:hypothetical protein
VVETSVSVVFVELGDADTSVHIDLDNSPSTAVEDVPQQNLRLAEFLVLLDLPAPFNVAAVEEIDEAAFVTALRTLLLSSKV